MVGVLLMSLVACGQDLDDLDCSLLKKNTLIRVHLKLKTLK